MSYIVKTPKGYVKVLNEQEDVAFKKSVSEATKFRYKYNCLCYIDKFKNSVIVELDNES